MKNLQKVFLIAMCLFSLNSFSQSIGNFIDVIYLKNGVSIKGVIIEQIPGKSVKIKISDGSEKEFLVSEIEKFTREEVVSISNMIQEDEDVLIEKPRWIDNFKKKDKGYFIELDMLINSLGQGWRITNGYKFGRFGYLGLGIGIENTRVGFNPDARNNPNFSPQINLNSVLNANIVYSGDILDKRITPFYQIEAGYGVPLNRNHIRNDGIGDLESRNYGGPMGALSFGVKFKTKKKIVYKLSLDSRYVSNFSENEYHYSNDLNSSIYKGTNKDFGSNVGMGIRFGIGF